MRILRRNGVAVRSPSEAHRKHECDHRYFEAVDSEEKAYWLGFVAADGCVTGNALQINLAHRDKEHLERLRAALKSTHPVRDGKTEAFGKTYSRASFAVRSAELVRGLKAHGIVERKSLVLRWPDFLPAPLLRHYLRGYADGDGWFHLDRPRPGHSRSLFFSLIGSRAFCLGVRRYLAEAAGANLANLLPAGKASKVSFGGNPQAGRIYALLYEGATVWLPRKRDVVAEHVRCVVNRPPARNLRRARLERGLSQERLAEKSGVCRMTICRLENGGPGFPPTVRKVAKALGVAPRDLVE